MGRFLRRLKNKKGFTLVELVVTMGVFGIFMLILSAYMGSTLNLFQKGNAEINLKTAADDIAQFLYGEVKSSREFVLRQDLGAAYPLNGSGALDEATYDDAANNKESLGNNAYMFSAKGQVWYTTKSGGAAALYNPDDYEGYKISALRFKIGGEGRNTLNITFKISDNTKKAQTISKSYMLKNLTDAPVETGADANPNHKKLYFTYAGYGYCQGVGGVSASWCGGEHNCKFTKDAKYSGGKSGYYDAADGTIHEWCVNSGDSISDIFYRYEPETEFAVLGYKRPERA